MTLSLQTALERLRQTSPAANKIIEERFQGFVSLSEADKEPDVSELSELVTKLLDVVEYQSKEIDDLTEQLRVEPKDFSADVAKFAEAIKGADVGQLLLFYDKKLLEPMKPETRKAICTVLSDYVTGQQKKPNILWTEIVANNGLLGE